MHWENGKNRMILRTKARRSVCAHSWKPQLLLAGCPPVPVSPPWPTCLCLGFLSFSHSFQIFSDATEECSDVIEAQTQWAGSLFLFQRTLYKEAALIFSKSKDQKLVWRGSFFLLNWWNTHTSARLYSSTDVNNVTWFISIALWEIFAFGLTWMSSLLSWRILAKNKTVV